MKTNALGFGFRGVIIVGVLALAVGRWTYQRILYP
jgi:hypothetical protein